MPGATITSIAGQIYRLVKNFPQDQASEILAFAEFIRSKHSISAERNSEETASHTTNTEDASIPWTELVASLTGAWADDFPTLESIRIGEEQDVLRESL